METFFFQMFTPPAPPQVDSKPKAKYRPPEEIELIDETFKPPPGDHPACISATMGCLPIRMNIRFFLKKTYYALYIPPFFLFPDSSFSTQ